MRLKSMLDRFKRSMKTKNETAARRTVLEELFYDFHRSRAEVYKVNFVRGISFGAGSVIGGTVIIALLVWLLSILGTFIPPLGDFFDALGETLKPTKN